MVAVELTLYNPYVRNYITGRIMFEIPASGGVFPSEEFVAFKMDLFDNMDSITLCSELVLVACFFRLIYEEYCDFHKWYVRYFQSTASNRLFRNSSSNLFRSLVGHIATGWNAVDIVNLALLFYWFVLRLEILVETYNLYNQSPNLLNDHSRFFNFQIMAYLNRHEQELLALAITLTWLKSLKYIVLLPGIGIAVQAIISTIIDSNVRSFMVLFALVSCSLSLALHFTIGLEVEEFNTLSISIMSFFRMLFGDFVYSHFKETYWSTFWFVLSLLMGSLVLVNIFVAVVGQVYDSRLTKAKVQWKETAILHYQRQLLESRDQIYSSIGLFIKQIIFRYQPTVPNLYQHTHRQQNIPDHYILPESSVCNISDQSMYSDNMSKSSSMIFTSGTSDTEQEQMQSQRADLQLQKAIVEAKRDELTIHQTELEVERRMIEARQSRLEIEKGEIEKSRIEMASLKSFHSSITSQLSELQQKYNQDKSEWETEVIKLKSMVKTEIEKNKEDKNMWEEEFKRILEISPASADEATTNIHSLRVQLIEQKRQIEVLKERCDMLSATNIQWSEKSTHLRTEYEKLQHDLQDERNTHLKEKRIAEREKAELEIALQKTCDQLMQAEQEIKSWSIKSKTLEEQNDVLNGRLEAQGTVLQHTLNKLSDKPSSSILSKLRRQS
eukprot:NODE_786_length_2360_cov_38.521234_g671_i0.p1 GENE.NODE_786_length_2360_cov_38.521234_g671_i0~~NODE_786_length_2360_cov_38.521234_g671_i0.p1  ORF type:complete len:745 (+),score=141.22 NODE_786_length_2360_cov_38.521234_g671_i0:234-2237(+)